MKHIIVYFVFSFTSLNVNALIVDSLLIKQYKRGYEVVHEIIESNSLKDSLANRLFCSLFFDNLWSITVKKDDSYVLYYGHRISKGKVFRKEISNSETVLNRLFSLEQDKVKQPIYQPANFYTPIYWYFLLLDSLHNKKYEWNAYSESNDKYAMVYLNAIRDYFVFLIIESEGY